MSESEGKNIPDKTKEGEGKIEVSLSQSELVAILGAVNAGWSFHDERSGM